MGLNVKDIHLRLFKVVQDSTKSSYSFMRRHPLVSGASLVCFILYVFLSYIYNLLVYMSPFLVCAVIFIKIFWSSEQTQLKYVKTNEEKGGQKKVEPKCPKIPNNRRPEMLYKYPSQNATSRRRNFRDKNWDVYGGLEEKAKDLSAVFHNEFTKRNIEKKGARYFEKGESALDNRLSTKKTQVPKRQILRSEPSMVDLVECSDLEIEKKIEDGDDEDGEETQEESNKAIEWTEDDQKNLMYLGNSEMERNRRLENLIARRRAKKLFKGQVEKGQIDKKPMAPVLTKRSNHLDSSSKDFDDGLDMPGSAPSLMPRSPSDNPYDPSEEKPNLTGDSFPQEFSSQKYMPFSRHESFISSHLFPSETKHDHGAREHYYFNKGRKYSDRLAYSRFRRPHTDKGTHDWLIDQLIYNESGENGLHTPNPPTTNGEESTHEEDGKCITDMENTIDENDHETKSMSGQISEPGSDRSRPWARFPKPHARLLSFPVSTTATTYITNINEALYDTVTSVVDKRQESMFLNHGRNCHTPTYSIASDLQVEVSEVGSPTSTVGENAETNSSIDRDSIFYDGDIGRDVSSGSEELWGASFHGGKEARGVRSEADNNAEVNNNSKDVVSSTTPRHIDENAADVSSMSSKSDVPEDTPTNAINNHHNFFGYMKYPVGETEAPQSSNSSHALDQLPNEAHSERPEEWCNMLENVTNEEQVINDVNNSTSTEQDNTENLRSNEEPSTLVMRQESIDETSNSSVSSSPRSVLPEKTMSDDVSPSTFDQDLHIDVQQFIMEGLAQETLNSESPTGTMPQTIQPTMDETTDESHNVDFNHSQEQTNPLENSIEESNVFGSMNDEEVSNMEEEDKSKNDENSEGNSDHLNTQATTESARPISEITTLEDTVRNQEILWMIK
ncbi:hypothetical protein glysoja_047794 [Glycine soja]|uniref:Transmembrane protein n=1 Tax=Glycine soja TaxID=3848 RepID=A0A0B2PXT2_GLYSO|nr:hypothetical protein glysoja_047794 [Glycine soja]